MIVTIFLIGLSIGLFYLFLTWNFDYWSKRGVVGPKAKPFYGNFPNAISQKLHMAYDVDNIYRKYKNEEDFVGIFGFRSPGLLIINPTLCHRILVNDFKHFHNNELSLMVDKKSDLILGNNLFVLTDDKWKEKRNLLTPGLSIRRIQTVYPVINRVCREMSEYVAKQIKIAPKDGIDARDLFSRFTIEVAIDCSLGLSAKSFSEKSTPILEMTKRIFKSPAQLLVYFICCGFIPSLKKVWKCRFITKEVEIFFTNLMKNAIDLRKSQLNQRDRVDFLNYMLQLQQKKRLKTEELTANSMTFLLDGFETTSTVISHCLLLLGRYPEIQERLRNEIMEHINGNGVVEFEKLGELPYLDACIHEAIRIFPPSFFTNKLCTEPIILTSKSGRSVKLEKDDVVGLPLYSIMTDEEFYPNPQEYQPERFLEENGGSVKDFREKGLYYGFGDGPRVCVGMRFALTQSKAALVEILSKFKVTVNPKTRTDNTFDPKYFVTRLEGGIWLDFEELN